MPTTKKTQVVNDLADIAQLNGVVEITDGQALVEHAAAQSMEPRSITQYQQEQLDAALGVIGQYASPEGMLTVGIVTAEQAARDFAMRSGMPLNDATTCVQEAWLRFTQDANARIGRVTVNLDLDGFDPLAPQVVFVSLPQSSPNFVPGRQQAMALAYFPQTTYQRVDRETGEVRTYGSWMDVPGFSHVIRYFPSRQAASEARTELYRAVSSFRRVGHEIARGEVSEAEMAVRSEERRSRLQVASVPAF